jgi:hypothetical protein
MPQLVVEIHVPLKPAPGVGESGYQFPWIDDVENFIAGLDEDGDVIEFDDGDEYGKVYVFFLTGDNEPDLLAVASDIATLDGVPSGAFAVVTHDEAKGVGRGRRVSLPIRRSR